MEHTEFLQLLEALTKLNPEQILTLQTAISDSSPTESKLIQRIEENFKAHPKCAHCHSDNVRKFGFQLGRQRYQCKDCHRTCNALTGTPLANIKATGALDQYLACMTTSMTLRPSAHECGISLDTSFHWRHRFMKIIEGDQAELLTGIVEMDETFFKESRKGERNLPRPARKRGGKKRLHSPKASASRKKPVKKIPVLVACDRQQNIVSGVLEHMCWEDMFACLEGRIAPETPVCADALLQHEVIARKLHVILKEMVITAGRSVIDGVFHLQHVNAYHSNLKSWINDWFKGVATKNLSKYLGWRRTMTAGGLAPAAFIEKIAGHWVTQLLS